MSDIVPPDARPAMSRNPQTLTLYGSVKIGKTESVTRLPRSASGAEPLVVMCQRGGGDHLAGRFIDVHALVDAGKFGDAIAKASDYAGAFYATLDQLFELRKAGTPAADFVAFDHLGIIEGWVFDRALATFRSTLIGKSEKFNDLKRVTDLPSQSPTTGSPGWNWVREEMHRTMWAMQRVAPHVVLIAHMRDKFALSATPKLAGEVMPNDIDLVGSLRKLCCSESSSIGFMYRTATGDLMLNFKTSDTTVCGSYCRHLRGREITLGKVVSGETVYDWSQVYLPDAPTLSATPPTP
jgi:hypothetical protein